MRTQSSRLPLPSGDMGLPRGDGLLVFIAVIAFAGFLPFFIIGFFMIDLTLGWRRVSPHHGQPLPYNIF